MKQAYEKKSNYFHLIGWPAACLSIFFNPWAGQAYAADPCDPDFSQGCAIEDRDFTVDLGDSFDVNTTLYVGYEKEGKLYMDGGVVTVSDYLQIAYEETSEGLVKVSGSNSKLNVGIDLNVGIGGKGELIVTDQADVNATQHVQIGLQGKGNSGIGIVTDGARLNIATGGNLYVGVGTNSNGSLIISEYGTVKLSDGDASVASNAGSKGVIYIGAVSGNAAVDPGSLEFETVGDGIAFGQGDGYVVFNHTDNNYVFAPKFRGGGTIQVENGKTVLKGNNNNFTGNINLYGGILSVGDKSNLGADDATLNFDGGVLHVDADNFGITGQNINIGPNHAKLDMAFNSLDDESMILAGKIVGPGDLIKLGRGNLELTGDNNYGNTIIEDGELIGNANSISGNVFILDGDTAAITFNQLNDASFTGNIVNVDNTGINASKTGAGTLRFLGQSNTGWYIEEGELISSADRLKGQIATEQAGFMNFEQLQDADFAHKIHGNGTIKKTGNAKLNLTANNSYFSGNTQVLAGTLSLASGAVLGGNVSVNNGAVLSGTGTVGTANLGHVTVNSGGTIAPGNSIGKLKVAGDLVFNPGSIYAVEVDPDSSLSDKIEVGGTAKLAGSVVHVGLNGNYKPSSTYSILTADNGLIGKFDDASSDFAFLAPVLAYDSNNVNLTLQRNETKFTDFAVTKNQKATAKGLASLPANSKLLQKFELLPKDTPASILDGLSGEVHAGLITALNQNSSYARTLSLSHLRSNINAGYKPGAAIAQANNMPMPAQAMPSSAALPLWVEVIGSKQRINGNSNSADLKQDTSGIFAGGDFPIGDGWRLGTSFGYTSGNMHMNDRNSKADIDTYTVTAYGGKSFPMTSADAKLNLLMGGSYSWHKIKTDRHTYLNGWSHKLKSNYKANTGQLFGELSYAMQFDEITIEPFAGLAWNRLSMDSFSESGGDTALSGKSQTQNNTSSILGLRAATEFDLGKSSAFAAASLGWQHTFGDIHPVRTMAFSGGDNFTITGAPIARDSAVVGLSAGVSLSKKARLGLAYNGQVGGGNTDHSGSINLNWQF